MKPKQQLWMLQATSTSTLFQTHSRSNATMTSHCFSQLPQVLPRYLLQFTFNPATRVEATNRSANALAARRQRFREELNELKSRVGQALAVLGPSAGDETDRMLNDLASKYEDALAGKWFGAGVCIE